MSESLPQTTQVDISFPDKLQCLFQPKRYKVLYGGRGGAKSWGLARALLLLAQQTPLRVLCARELQNSIAESVHRLLSDQVAAMGLGGFYEIQRDKLIGQNGSGFFFEGIRNNVDKIKSYEGVDICWVEEAHKVSESSWKVLIPTIRKDSSEIWMSFNPDLESDYTYQNFVVKPQPDSFVVFMNWRDNPWFNETLRREKDALKERDPDSYLNVWEGQCRVLLEGAVFADELRLCYAQRRVTVVPYDPTKPVEVFFDLGIADATAVWFRQKCGFEWHYIDYLEARQKPINHYLMALQERKYVYSTIWLPHDARAREKGTGMTIEERVRKVFPTRVVRRTRKNDQIDAARTIFSSCWFDRAACATGLKALGHYRYQIIDEGGQLSREPVHDWSSHAADAFLGSAVATSQPRSERLADQRERMEKVKKPLNIGDFANFGTGEERGLGWMG